VAIETSGNYSVAIVGNGWVGKAYNKMFPDAVVYDEPQIKAEHDPSDWDKAIEAGRLAVNACDLALVAVPTNPTETGQLDMTIVEDVVRWVDSPLILIKSALQPGTVDRLVEETGKNIAVSVEMVGEGKYFVPFWKYPDAEDPRSHDFLIVGGEDETAQRCADFLWSKMSPDINIHLTTAKEAEIVKLMENTWGAMKVTFANVIYDICEAEGANYTRVLQAWGSDGRTEKMHMRVVPNKRGWRSKCYDKDIPALSTLDRTGWLRKLIEVNRVHLDENKS
jgi:UDP-glucose 6-dehydrogenase